MRHFYIGTKIAKKKCKFLIVEKRENDMKDRKICKIKPTSNFMIYMRSILIGGP